MTTLNRSAADAMVEVGVSAATDVTGFGLLGHLHNALTASGVSARLDASAIVLLPGTMELAEQGVVPGGTKSNYTFVTPFVDWGELPEAERLVLADAQTSGGLLISVPEEGAEALAAALVDRGVDSAEIGTVLGDGESGAILIEGRLRSPR